jgi:hypothetical protein
MGGLVHQVVNMYEKEGRRYAVCACGFTTSNSYQMQDHVAKANRGGW